MWSPLSLHTSVTATPRDRDPTACALGTSSSSWENVATGPQLLPLAQPFSHPWGWLLHYIGPIGSRLPQPFPCCGPGDVQEPHPVLSAARGVLIPWLFDTHSVLLHLLGCCGPTGEPLVPPPPNSGCVSAGRGSALQFPCLHPGPNATAKRGPGVGCVGRDRHGAERRACSATQQL